VSTHRASDCQCTGTSHWQAQFASGSLPVALALRLSLPLGTGSLSEPDSHGRSGLPVMPVGSYSSTVQNFQLHNLKLLAKIHPGNMGRSFKAHAQFKSTASTIHPGRSGVASIPKEHKTTLRSRAQSPPRDPEKGPARAVVFTSSSGHNSRTYS
jgi:hypothetical protein